MRDRVSTPRRGRGAARTMWPPRFTRLLRRCRKARGCGRRHRRLAARTTSNSPRSSGSAHASPWGRRETRAVRPCARLRAKEPAAPRRTSATGPHLLEGDVLARDGGVHAGSERLEDVALHLGSVDAGPVSLRRAREAGRGVGWDQGSRALPGVGTRTLSSLATSMKLWEKSMPTTSSKARAISKLERPTAQPTSRARVGARWESVERGASLLQILAQRSAKSRALCGPIA